MHPASGILDRTDLVLERSQGPSPGVPAGQPAGRYDLAIELEGVLQYLLGQLGDPVPGRGGVAPGGTQGPPAWARRQLPGAPGPWHGAG